MVLFWKTQNRHRSDSRRPGTPRAGGAQLVGRDGHVRKTARAAQTAAFQPQRRRNKHLSLNNKHNDNSNDEDDDYDSSSSSGDDDDDDMQ